MVKKLKITIDRDECVSDSVCASICPDVFIMDDEDLSAIAEEYRVNGNVGEGIVPIDFKDCVEEAAESCPVQIIHVEEIDE